MGVEVGEWHATVGRRRNKAAAAAVPSYIHADPMVAGGAQRWREEHGGGGGWPTGVIFACFIRIFVFSRDDMSTRGCATCMEILDFRKPFQGRQAGGPYAKITFGCLKKLFLLGFLGSIKVSLEQV